MAATKLMDRQKGGTGLEEANWLVDEELQEKVKQLSRNHRATSGEIFRHALKRGLRDMEEN